MSILLVFFSFLITIVLFQIKNGNSELCSISFLKTSILYGLLIAVTTELLSFWHLLNYNFIFSFWILFLLANIFILITARKKQMLIFYNFSDRVLSCLLELEKKEKKILLILSLILCICLATALMSIPSNYDSMTYHMPRIMHWIQNQSVSHYPTNNLRQIAFSPGAAYIVTHLQILSGGDYFANCVQWMAFLGSLIGVTLITRDIIGNKFQTTAALLYISIPMAIMQSTTTQNDLLLSFWLVCFVFFIFRLSYNNYKDLFWVSSAFGLAILTKPTAIIFGTPFIIIFWLQGIKKNPLPVRLKQIFYQSVKAGVIPLGAISLSLPHLWRNYEVFGTFFVSMGTKNTTVGLSQTVSNILRTLSLNVPYLKFWEVVRDIHYRILKMDINDSSITFDGNIFDPNLIPKSLLSDENFVGAPIHTILFFLAVISILSTVIIRKRGGNTKILELMFGILIGGVLFCSLIKWQIWSNRLILPLFILGVPVISFFMNQYFPIILKNILKVILIFVAAFYSLTPIHHPLISLPEDWTDKSQVSSIYCSTRDEQYISFAGKEIEIYQQIINQFRDENCRLIGIDIEWDDLEYPIWVMSAGSEPFKIKHFNVQNESAQLESEFPDADLCGIIQKRGKEITYYKVNSY